jgi:hypothetical protein
VGSSPAQRIKVRTASMASSRLGRRTARDGLERCSEMDTDGAKARGIKILLAVGKALGRRR